MRRIFIAIAACAAALVSLAGTPQEDIAALLTRSASNHALYPETNLPDLTPAPAGYEAFYIDHYGRHGSRWLTRSSSYERSVEILGRAHADGNLTEQGERLFSTLRTIMDAARNRAGELSDRGAEQHQHIAERMYKNFPTVFADDAQIDARSTVVIRCILSMQNATNALRALNPRLNITTDASYHDMYYMGYGHGEDTLANKVRTPLRAVVDSIYAENVHPERFAKQIFNTVNTDDLGMLQRLMREVFDIAGSLQGFHQFDDMDLYHLFTTNEIFELWRLRNLDFYIRYANSPLNGNRVPYQARELVRYIVEKADAAIAQGKRGADLRFGHETIILPLVCMLELGDINLSTDDLDNLHNVWRSYEIIPKACNVQFIFYRNAAGNILVKALYNEHEVKLPVNTDMFPYYRWDDLRDYYLAKIATPIDWTPTH